MPQALFWVLLPCPLSQRSPWGRHYYYHHFQIRKLRHGWPKWQNLGSNPSGVTPGLTRDHNTTACQCNSVHALNSPLGLFPWSSLSWECPSLSYQTPYLLQSLPLWKKSWVSTQFYVQVPAPSCEPPSSPWHLVPSSLQWEYYCPPPRAFLNMMWEYCMWVCFANSSILCKCKGTDIIFSSCFPKQDYFYTACTSL